MLNNGGNTGPGNPEALKTADNFMLVLHARYGAHADELIKDSCDKRGLDYGSFCQNVGEFTIRMLPAVHNLHALGKDQVLHNPDDRDRDANRAIMLYQNAGCSIEPIPTELGVAA